MPKSKAEQKRLAKNKRERERRAEIRAADAGPSEGKLYLTQIYRSCFTVKLLKMAQGKRFC
jgi:hypothetical protein